MSTVDQEKIRLAAARERARRACIHRQLGALEGVLARMPKPHSPREWLKRRRLELKVRKLRAELDQPWLPMDT
jgi:hypothetical protein